MDRPFSLEEMTQAELCDKKEFPFMKGCGVFKIPRAKRWARPSLALYGWIQTRHLHLISISTGEM
jgi:hypothetical protein